MLEGGLAPLNADFSMIGVCIVDMKSEWGEFQEKTGRELESKMQKISLAISITALILMIFGFADALLSGYGRQIPGPAAFAFSQLGAFRYLPLGLSAMTYGIILFAALPIVRILLALWLYLRRRSLINMGVALVVLLELLFSAHMGR